MRVLPGHSGEGKRPDAWSILTKVMPGGGAAGGAGARRASQDFMMFVQMGSAAEPPEARKPICLLSSRPTQTPRIRLSLKPMNQASRYSFVVPVFPATKAGSFLASLAVPSVTTPCSRERT